MPIVAVHQSVRLQVLHREDVPLNVRRMVGLRGRRRTGELGAPISAVGSVVPISTVGNVVIVRRVPIVRHETNDDSVTNVSLIDNVVRDQTISRERRASRAC